MAFISAFQAEDGGSIPPTRSRKTKTRALCPCFCFAKVEPGNRTVGNELSRRSADRGVASVGESELAQDSTPTLGNERASEERAFSGALCRKVCIKKKEGSNFPTSLILAIFTL